MPVDPNDKDRTKNPLRHFDQWSGGKLPEGLSKEDMIFIEYGKTPRSRAMEGLDDMEANYLAHTFNVSMYSRGEGEGDAMCEHLEFDPFGEVIPDYSDTLCWNMRYVPNAGAATSTSAAAVTDKTKPKKDKDKSKSKKGKGKSKKGKGKKKKKSTPAKGPADAASATAKQSDSDSSSDSDSDTPTVSQRTPVPSTFYQNLQSL